MERIKEMIFNKIFIIKENINYRKRKRKRRNVNKYKIINITSDFFFINLKNRCSYEKYPINIKNLY